MLNTLKIYIQYIQGLCQSRLSTADFAIFLVASATTAVSYQFSPMEKHFTFDAAFKTKVIMCTEK
jgi:hypothetical protein